ncbi:hypothetical protein MUU75_05680 [Pseudoxanthomonas mexicana]|uniref:hypothetical protein n=1 Tax=Pseudoxanthomonas mexicana TaxID=128785 RepID=UPI001FD65FDD|nr:hypothetical protein [Pseudoxanthomonas mexicana]UOV06164.1 hypothetical protein MUU75_05680 [Pseudoxanthomonas mexicana]
MVERGGEMRGIACDLLVRCRREAQARAATAGHRGESAMSCVTMERMAHGSDGEGVQRAAFARIEIRCGDAHRWFVQCIHEAGMRALQRAGVRVQAIARARPELRQQHHFHG